MELRPGLPSFPVLHHLFLNTLLLYDSEDESPHDDGVLTQLLPPSIVSLKLADNTAEPGPKMSARLAKGLLGLAKAALQRQFRKLRIVRCDTGQRLDDHGVREMFECAGVDFGYDTWPFTDEIPRRQMSGSQSSSEDDEYVG